MILIEHETGAQFIYCSLGKININKGDTVSQGDVIATSGESLYTSGLGQSLHFEVLNSEGEYKINDIEVKAADLMEAFYELFVK